MSKTSAIIPPCSELARLKPYFHTKMEPAILAGLRDAPHKNSGNSFRKFGLPPRPKGFTPKQFAIYLLRVGAEIEHSLAIQYLYAAYAIDETSEDAGNLPVL